MFSAAKRLFLAALALALVSQGAIAATVAVFDNGTYVDTNNIASSESDNVQASLTSLGHTVNPFTGITAADFTAAFNANDFVFFPEMEVRNLDLDLDPAARNAILSAVSGGKTLVTHNQTTVAFLNGVFGTSLSVSGSGVSSLNSGAASGTAYAGGPASLTNNSQTSSIAPSSFPVGTVAFYTRGGGEATVMSFPVGSGRVLFLGWDWFNSNPPNAAGLDGGWINVLERTVIAAVSQGVVVSDATPVPVVFASEINATTGSPVTLVNNGGSLNLVSALGYSFSQGEVRYARVECPSTVTFLSGSAVTASSAANLGAINGLGTNVITFSITATNATTNAASTITVSGDRAITATTAAACSYSLYDQPSQAQAGGTAGRIATRSGNYIAFATSYTLAATATGAVANVEASPSFSRFVSASPTNSINTTSLGTATLALRSPAPLIANGTAVTLATILGATSNHTVAGDFSAAANADGTFTGAALNRVYFSNTADCSAVTTAATAVTATSARFTTGAGPVAGLSLCYSPRTGVAIPVSTYAQTFNAVSADADVYTVGSLGPVNLGSITRNGTQLQAPFAQVPAGWLSRVVLTNTGSVARPYTITAQTEAGVTSALGTAASGSIPANGTIVLNTSDIASFTGSTRGTLNVTVAGPNNDIQGLYQIVNGATGSIANTAMVRPGTN